ncbi:circadian clock protein PASD1-like [Spodoptera litura]|uniref:Circadian clock protein PASD1-like n=1 Tax=Spodoptera litura TaxID=69820 RepID=A0A9J7EJ38_SPOLT|nr:circadian clock protein PASD1-like [Spodoptera litura]
MFGFKASLNFYNGSRRKSKKERAEIGAVLSVTGAYRTNRDDSFGYNYPEMRKSTPALYNQPPPAAAPPVRPMRQAKSTSNLILDKNLPPNLRPENPGVSKDPRGAEQDPRNNRIPDKSKERKLDAQIRVDKQRLEEQKKLEKQRIEEQKKLEKQRAAEQKKRDKLAMKEQARQEKLRKEMEKQSKKGKAPPPPLPPGGNPVAPVRQPQPQALLPPGANPVAQLRQQPQPSTSNAQPAQMTHSTNTLESSISKSSGPPPYSASRPEGEKDATGNVIYTKPDEEDSWDMISKHRENMNRAAAAAAATAAAKSSAKQTVMDLNYKVGDDSKDNSEA